MWTWEQFEGPAPYRVPAVAQRQSILFLDKEEDLHETWSGPHWSYETFSLAHLRKVNSFSVSWERCQPCNTEQCHSLSLRTTADSAQASVLKQASGLDRGTAASSKGLYSPEPFCERFTNRTPFLAMTLAHTEQALHLAITGRDCPRPQQAAFEPWRGHHPRQLTILIS